MERQGPKWQVDLPPGLIRLIERPIYGFLKMRARLTWLVVPFGFERGESILAFQVQDWQVARSSSGDATLPIGALFRLDSPNNVGSSLDLEVNPLKRKEQRGVSFLRVPLSGWAERGNQQEMIILKRSPLF